MAYTTTTAIREALETLIKGTDPGGLAMGQGKYRQVPSKIPWEDVQDTHRDRGFMVGAIQEDLATMFGSVSEYDYEGAVEIKIRHQRGKGQNCLDRMNTDLVQLREVLEKKTNFPSAVYLLRLGGWETIEEEKFWDTTMNFRAVYSRAAP